MKEKEPFNWDKYSQNPDKYQVITRHGWEIGSITFDKTRKKYPLIAKLDNDAILTYTTEGFWDSSKDDPWDLVTMRSKEHSEIASVEPITLPDNVEDGAVLIYKMYNPDIKKHELKCMSYRTQENALKVAESVNMDTFEVVAIMPISSIPGVLEVLNTKTP